MKNEMLQLWYKVLEIYFYNRYMLFWKDNYDINKTYINQIS